jgi:hypothetical protein
MRTLLLRAVLASLTTIVAAFAQVTLRVPLTYYIADTTQYDPAIPTPEQFFGFQVGEWHLTPDQLYSYLTHLDAASERMAIHSMGRTVEQRPVLLLVITDPDNHGDLERIRQEHLRLSDPAAAAPDLERMPVVVWMGYSVHGNEASGSNAAALVAYHLAASRSAETHDQLRNAVILLNPCINPDGLHRFASWVNANRGQQVVSFSASREHQEPWPGGRGNHYWFDLNRDWMPVVHPESRARIAAYYAWRPNLLTDHHEMGTNATFFFQPGVPSRNHPLVPKGVVELTMRLANYHAEALDRIGSLYYTRESFDDFYVGKGSSYPDLTGGVGILFEQASSRGHAQDSHAGVLTFRFAVRNQFTTSLSSLRGAVAMRTEFLKHQRQAAVSALSEADASAVKAYVIGDDGDAARGAAFAEILMTHRIEVFRTARSFKQGRMSVDAGRGYVIPVRQPQARLVASLFERRTSFDDSLFYDISSWNLPMAFNLPVAELSSLPAGLQGERIGIEASLPQGVLPLPEGLALAMDWNNASAPSVLYRLLSAEVPVRVATSRFEARTSTGVRAFDPGTILVPPSADPGRMALARQWLAHAASSFGLGVEVISSGLAASGVDLGSSSFVPLTKPRIALVTGVGASTTDAGEVWHLFDARLGIPVALIGTDVVGRSDLSAFNVMIIAGSAPSPIDSAGRAALAEWVGRGNTLIATEQGAEWAIGAKLSSAVVKRQPSRRDSALVLPYDVEDKYRGARSMPGAIVEVQLDLSHPLSFGYRSPAIPSFKSTGIVFDVPRSPFAMPMRLSERPLLSGYLHRDAARHISGGGSIIVSAVRDGRSIVMSDNPVFRGFWRGTERLLVNAVFFGPVIRASSLRTGE